MEQIGYSLVDSGNSNNEIQSWGSIPGQVPGVPNMIFLPNGDSVCAPTLGKYGTYNLVKKMVDDNKPSIWHQKTSENISFDVANNQVVVTYVYPGPANLLPETVTPLQMRKALRQSGLRTTVETYVQSLSDEEKDEWEYATEIKRDHEAINNGATALGKTQEDIDNLFRLAATL